MKKTDFFWSAAILILILLSLLLPHSGPTALFGAFMRTAAIACALFFVAFRIIKSRPRQALRQQAMPGFAAAACIIAALFFLAAPVLDLVKGPVSVNLHNVQTIHESGFFGILSSHYCLSGVSDDGKKVKIEISGSDFTDFSGQTSIHAEYYLHTKLLVRFSIM